MKTWLVKDARAHLSDVISSALSGEPQRVTRRGREAVVVVSEAEWNRARPPETPGKSLADIVAAFPLSAEEWNEVRPHRRPYKPSVNFED